mmetsp:Transcript_8051/g.13393  ORF Transcript_8051/g.13393 Transcript_8051/m.13393 type:complete len:544 (-) Transcript_8051:9-1640(-)
MPVGDSKVAELAKLKNKILEVESQLKEEKKITVKLRDNSEKKIQIAMQMDAEIASEVERFKWKREKSIADRNFLEEQSLTKLGELARREITIKQDIAEFDLIVYENDLLHKKLKEVSSLQLKNAGAQAKERDKKSQRNFDARIELEDVHRHTIQSFNNNYQQEAIAKMEMEASQASSENDRIYAEFDSREEKTNKLIRQQQLSYDQLMHVKIERDVVAVSVAMQDKDISELTKQNEVDSTELAELMASVQLVREENRHLRANVSEKKQIMKQLKQLKAELEPYVQQVQELQNNVMEICDVLLHEGLDIAKKERAFQSSQIASKIDGISSASMLVPDFTPVTSPFASPNHSVNNSANNSFVQPIDDDDDASVASGISLHTENNSLPPPLGHDDKGRGDYYYTQPNVIVDPDAIWKTDVTGAKLSTTMPLSSHAEMGQNLYTSDQHPAAAANQHQNLKHDYVTARDAKEARSHMGGNGAAEQEMNHIRRRLKELRDISKFHTLGDEIETAAAGADQDGRNTATAANKASSPHRMNTNTKSFSMLA